MTPPIETLSVVALVLVAANNVNNTVGEGHSTTVLLEKRDGEERQGKKEGMVVVDKKQCRETISENAPKKMTKTEQEVKTHFPNLVNPSIRRSSLWQRLQNRKFMSGSFVGSPKRDKEFAEKVKSLDCHSTVKDPKTVRQILPDESTIQHHKLCHPCTNMRRTSKITQTPSRWHGGKHP